MIFTFYLLNFLLFIEPIHYNNKSKMKKVTSAHHFFRKNSCQKGTSKMDKELRPTIHSLGIL